MNTTNDDITDSLIYGYVPKEDIIRYNINDTFFKNFEFREYEFDDIQNFNDLTKGEKYYGCWEYDLNYGLGISQSIIIEDDENNSTICKFKLETSTDSALKSVYQDYPYEIIDGNINDFGDLLMQKIYTITSRNMLKEIIQKEWLPFCKEALHKKIIFGYCFNENLDKIHEFQEVQALNNHYPGPSHHELRKQYRDYCKNIIDYHTIEIFLERPNKNEI